MYDGGGYLYPLTTVSPHQTNTIDIRALRDNHVPDANGNTIPTSIARGQIEWSMTGGEDRVMIGRSEQVDLSKRISSNYACMNCCGNSFYEGWIAPDDGSGFQGEHIQFIAFEQDANCYEQTLPPYQRGAAFGNFNSSICESDLNGLTILNATGQTSIQGGWTADSWLSFGGPHSECQYSPIDVFRDALCDVFGLEVDFTTISLLQTTKTAQFNLNNVTFDIRTDIPPSACGGDMFWIRTRFDLPPDSRGCCSGGNNFVKLEPHNEFTLLDALFYENQGGRDGFVDIKLRRSDVEGTSNKLSVNIYGTYGNGDAYRGLGVVRLKCY